MLPLRIADATRKMLAPKGMEDEVRPLYILDTQGYCVSRWEPTPDELATLNAGGSVELWVMGGQPPVYVGAHAHAVGVDMPVETVI